MAAGEAPPGAEAQKASGKPEDFAQARLGPHWQLCGMLGEDNERMLTALCCDLIDVLHKFALRMPQPPLALLREADMHACEHPRSVLFNVLQLLIQLGRRWDNARRLSETGCVEQLLSMPVPALCTGSLEDITVVLQQVIEDPVHTHPVRLSSALLRCAVQCATFCDRCGCVLLHGADITPAALCIGGVAFCSLTFMRVLRRVLGRTFGMVPLCHSSEDSGW